MIRGPRPDWDPCDRSDWIPWQASERKETIVPAQCCAGFLGGGRSHCFIVPPRVGARDRQPRRPRSKLRVRAGASCSGARQEGDHQSDARSRLRHHHAFLCQAPEHGLLRPMGRAWASLARLLRRMRGSLPWRRLRRMQQTSSSAFQGASSSCSARPEPWSASS